MINIDPKCKKFPYCSQGAIDKPLNISKTNKGSGSYVEDFMKNIHEACVKYGSDANGYTDYVKGANIAGFVKVADAMLGQGVV